MSASAVLDRPQAASFDVPLADPVVVGFRPHLSNIELLAARRSAFELSRLIANEKVSVSDALDALCSLPDNLLGLLESPEGWAALSQYVAVALGQSPARLDLRTH